MAQFSITDLKTRLAQKNKAELIQEISTLCQTFPQVKGYYQAQSSDIQNILEKYKNIIKKEFVATKSQNLPKARFAVARQAINNFKKITKEPELIADIMLTYVESVSCYSIGTV